MRNKTKRFLALIIVFAMIISSNIGVFAEILDPTEDKLMEAAPPEDEELPPENEELPPSEEEELPPVDEELPPEKEELPPEVEEELPIEEEELPPPEEEELPPDEELPPENEDLPPGEELPPSEELPPTEELPPVEPPIEIPPIIEIPIVTEASYSIEYLVSETGEEVPGLDSINGIATIGDVIEISHPSVEGFKVLDDQPTELQIEEDESLNEVIVYYEMIPLGIAKLTINHILLIKGEEDLLEEEIREDYIIGDIVIGEDLVDQLLVENNFQFLYSDPEELILDKVENFINLYYEIGKGDNPDKLTEPEEISAPNLEEYSFGELGPFNDFELPRFGAKSFSRAIGVLSHASDHNNIEPPAPGSLDINKWATPTTNPNQWRVDLTLEGKDIPTTSDIVLVIDRSGSMAGSKLTNAKNAAKEFVNTLLDDVNDTSTRIAVISFAGSTTVHSNPSPFKNSTNKQTLINTIDGLSSSGGTFTQAGIRQARLLLEGSTAVTKNIVLLSDGEPTYSYAIDKVDQKLNSTYFVNVSGSNWNSKNNLSESVFDYTETVGDGSSITEYIGRTGNLFNRQYYYYHNGNSAIAESRFAKDDGNILYTIALDAGTNGTPVLNNIASPGKSFSGSASDLQNIFQTIAGDISFAATDATIIDPVGSMFSIPGINSSNYQSLIHVNRGTISWNDTTETITWQLDTISEGNPATMWYIVEIDPSAISGVVYPTNGHTYIGYTNALGADAQKTFPEPEAGIDAGTIKVHYYRVNSLGQPINSLGQVITKEGAQLQELTYMSGTDLELNTPYVVSGPGNINIGGDNYQYNPAGNVGDPNPATVTLTPAMPSAHVWFAYVKGLTPIPLTVTANSDTRVYNGNLQTVTGYTVTSGLLAGHELSGISASGSGTNVGNYPVTFTGTPKIMDGSVDVTSNYVIELVPGNLAITKAQIALTATANSDTKVYNGSLQTVTGYTVTSGLLAGHELSGISASGSGTNVGNYSVTFTGTPVIMDGLVEVTSNYVIELVPGNLDITAAELELTVTANSDTRVYNGNLQTVTGYTVTSGLLAGHELSGISASGSGTNVGNYPVTFTGTPTIMEGLVDVTANYSVTLVPGNLEITAAELELVVTANSDTRVYNGNLQTVTGYTVTLGLLAGHELSGISASGSGTNVGNYPVTFTGTPKIMDGSVDVTSNYVIELVPGNLAITKAQIALTATANSDTKVYNGSLQTVTGYTVTSGLLAGHELSGISASGSGTNIGNYPVTFTGTPKIMDGSVDVTSNYVIELVPGNLAITAAELALVVTANSDTRIYNGSLQTVTGYTVTSGLLAGHELSGISASGSGTNVGNYSVTFTGTPVIMDGLVEVTSNYVIELVPGNLEITQAELELVVTANSDTRVYNGNLQTVTGYTVTSGLLAGHELSGISASGSGTNVGNYPVTFTGTPEIMDGDVDVSENYSVTLVQGNLEITAAELELILTANSDSRIYNGSLQTVTGYTVTSGLLAGHELSGISASGSGTNVGNYPVTFTGTPKIMDGPVDVAANYSVTLVPGNLEITQAELELVVTANSDSRVYNGSEQTVTGYTVTSGLLAGHELSGISASGSGTNVGNYPVTFTGTPVIMDGLVEVTSNYVIELVPGNLAITAAQIALTVTANSNTKLYDGLPLIDSGWTLTSGALLSEDVLEVTVVGSITNVGTIANEITLVKVMNGTTDVTENYVITKIDGQLEITGTPAISISKSADKEIFSSLGEEITYTYVITNTGNVTLDGPFTIVDDKIGTIDTSSAPASLAPEASFSITAVYEVTQTDLDAGFVTNVVRATLIFEEEEVPAEDEVTVFADGAPSVTISKVANVTSFNSVGQIITYTITVRNTGNTTLTEIVVSDPLINLIGPSGDANSNGKLDVGETWTYTGTYSITSANMTEGRVVNVATVDTEETVPVTDSETITRIVPPINPPGGGGGGGGGGDDDDDDDDEVTIEEVVPEAVPELNREDHFQYIQGYPDNTVRPEGLITREEVSAVFYRLLTAGYRESIKTTAENFADVMAARWSLRHIATLANGRIVEGYPDGSFRPSNFITRAELATIASRFDNLTPFVSDSYSDITGHWANKYINSAAQKGWVKGYPDGTFKPDQYITRAEFVTLVNNVLGRRVHKDDLLPESRQFPDLNVSAWYYEAMQEAINSHLNERKEDTFELWNEIVFPILDM